MKKLTQEIIIAIGSSAEPEDFEVKLDTMLGDRIRRHAQNPTNIHEFLELVTHGIRKGDSLELATSLAACGFALKAMEIEI